MLPAGVLVQVPCVAGKLHASHAPEQLVSQHTPSTHWALRHELAVEQVFPRTFFGTQAEPTQYWPATQSVSTTQPPGQEFEVPEQTRGAQLGLPLEPAGTLEQVPTLPVRLQASHAPAQVEAQHTASTQLPETHSLSALQEVPRIFRGTQAVPLQYRPATHWASAVQLAGQAGAVPEQRYGIQAGLPGEPPGVLVHVPTVPARLQALQLAAQAVLQHTPFTQSPLTHSLVATHVAPRTFFGTQALPLQ